MESSCSATEKIDTIHNWLHSAGVAMPSPRDFVDAYCVQLRSLDIPIDRFWMSAVVLHPLTAAHAVKWEAEGGRITERSWSRDHFIRFVTNPADNQQAAASRSPMYQLMMGAASVTIKDTDSDIPPDCNWMIPEGYTELFALPPPGKFEAWSLEAGVQPGKLEGGFTWSTKQVGGFTEQEKEILIRTVGALSTVTRLYIALENSKSLLQAYLGEDAGSRVHRGEIDRGEGLTIRSVVWFSDVRGFTQMSCELSRLELIDVLNSVFELTHKIIHKHGGQILKLIGDGCMAIFSQSSKGFQRHSFSSGDKIEIDDEQGARVCASARMAAAELQSELSQWKLQRETRGLKGASVGVGLHYGDVSYGNVGAAERLDFTVLGPCVNLASRTEGMCSNLGAKVLATGQFVQLDRDPDAWKCRGEYELKGVSCPTTIFELREDEICVR
jgi:adenylate cyclase